MAVEGLAVERQAVEGLAVEGLAVERQAVERQAVERHAVERQAVDPLICSIISDIFRSLLPARLDAGLTSLRSRANTSKGIVIVSLTKTVSKSSNCSASLTLSPAGIFAPILEKGIFIVRLCNTPS